MAATRAAVARFDDRAVAITAGYRRVGGDFPSMGEHWVNRTILLSGNLDPTRPAILAYARIGARVELIGVAFVVALAAGEQAPTLPGAARWHEHNGTVNEESIAPEHGDGAAEAIDTTFARVAIAHAWIGLPNPGGTFVAENWALPFARLGIAVPQSYSVDAARALSLLTGSREFFVQQLRRPSIAGDETILRARLDECRSVAEHLVAGRPNGAGLDSITLDALAQAWKRGTARRGS